MSKPGITKGTYKYYQIIVRKKGPVLTQEIIDGIRRAVWSRIGDITMADIVGRKISKPHNLKWWEGG